MKEYAKLLKIYITQPTPTKKKIKVLSSEAASVNDVAEYIKYLKLNLKMLPLPLD